MRRSILGTAIIGLAAAVGVAAFLYPLLLPSIAGRALSGEAYAGGAPLLTGMLLLFTIAVLLLEAQGQRTSAKTIAALGVLVAAVSVLRFIEVAIPGPGGFSPIFVPIIIAGYVFGARFGFLMGSLTILVSALLTGGIGPWLPYQMLATGWAGLTAGLLPQFQKPAWIIAVLVAFAFLWGILYGLVMNLYFWPFLTGDITVSGDAIPTVSSTLANYGAYYIATSAVWDLTRATGNALLMFALGLPAVRALQRFRNRFQFEVVQFS
ncbi:MAG: ECF transporter S component [Candidatus Promineifilaceae bacterium]